jgi:hypothetical protein
MSLTAPWPLSAANTLPADFHSFPNSFMTETWVLKPVVAPHERSNTIAALLPVGLGTSERTLFSQGSAQETNQDDNATSEIPLKCDTAHGSRVVDVRWRYIPLTLELDSGSPLLR